MCMFASFASWMSEFQMSLPEFMNITCILNGVILGVLIISAIVYGVFLSKIYKKISKIDNKSANQDSK